MGGGWKSGLFEVTAEPGGLNNFLMSWCCGCFPIAEIHEHLGSPWGLSKPMSCVFGMCACRPYQIVVYGQKLAEKGGFKDKEPIHCGILKTWCCGACYLAQEYREACGQGLAVKAPA